MRNLLIIGALLLIIPDASNAQKNIAFCERISERRQLIYNELAQYRGIEIFDTTILAAMFRVPRHAFVPYNVQPYAYNNTPLPIGYNQTISQPLIVASMTQILDVEPGMKILEIGTGSGYQAALLAEMGAQVFTVEIIKELGMLSSMVLKELGYLQINVKIGDGYEGWSEFAPFDRIIVTCAPENVPDPLKIQLKNGGKMVIPVGPENQLQYLLLLEKDDRGNLNEEMKYPVRFVPMTGKSQKQ